MLSLLCLLLLLDLFLADVQTLLSPLLQKIDIPAIQHPAPPLAYLDGSAVNVEADGNGFAAIFPCVVDSDSRKTSGCYIKILFPGRLIGTEEEIDRAGPLIKPMEGI